MKPLESLPGNKFTRSEEEMITDSPRNKICFREHRVESSVLLKMASSEMLEIYYTLWCFIVS